MNATESKETALYKQSVLYIRSTVASTSRPSFEPPRGVQGTNDDQLLYSSYTCLKLYSKCRYVLYSFLFNFHCVLIELYHIFIPQYMCMTKSDKCLVKNGTTEECSVNKGNRATGNL